MSTASSWYDMEIVARYYVKYRPHYPPEVYEKIFTYLDEGSNGIRRRELVLDVGCGTGQSSLALAKYFDKVIGVDTSEAQLKEATKISREYQNIKYILGSAENLISIVEEVSVDLIVVSTAIHFFDVEDFYGQCLKVLKPGGAVAFFSYDLPTLENRDADKLIQTLFHDKMKHYWGTKVIPVFEHYTRIGIPMKNFFSNFLRDDEISFSFNWNSEDMLGFIHSFPDYFHYKKDHVEDAENLLKRLSTAIESAEDRLVRVSFPVVLLLGRRI